MSDFCIASTPVITAGQWVNNFYFEIVKTAPSTIIQTLNEQMPTNEMSEAVLVTDPSQLYYPTAQMITQQYF